MPLPAVCSSRVLAPPPSLETSPNLTEDDPIMTIPPEREAQILRYFHVEKWPPTTIARQLNINRGTVRRVLAQAGTEDFGAIARACGLTHIRDVKASVSKVMVFDKSVAAAA